MPARPRKPVKDMRLPKGHARDDYTEEALIEKDRNDWRKKKRGARKRLRHAGRRDLTLYGISNNAREMLDYLCRERGTSRAKLVESLIIEEAKAHVQRQPTQCAAGAACEGV